MITPENIQQPPSFLNIKDTVQQSLILKKDSIKRIRHGVDLATNTSLQRYVEVEHPSQRELSIVSDLLDAKISLSGGKCFLKNADLVITVFKPKKMDSFTTEISYKNGKRV